MFERTCIDCGNVSQLGWKPKPAIHRCYRCAAINRRGGLYARLDAGILVNEDGCWIWTGNLSADGYGRISVNGAQRGTHRVNYERHVGPVPMGYQIDHLCRVRACCNPQHLEAVLPLINVLRSSGRAAINARKAECIHGHPFDEQNTITYADARGAEHRACRTCRRAIYRRYDERRRERKRS